jgi:hypothetical protein
MAAGKNGSSALARVVGREGEAPRRNPKQASLAGEVEELSP